MTEDEIDGWHHRCNGHELGQTLGDGVGQRSLAYCSLWGRKELDTIERLNNSNKYTYRTASLYCRAVISTTL